MSFDDFRKNYNRVYVLRLMTDAEGEVWYKSTFHGEFRGETAGGCTNHASWIGNPQFGVTVTKPTKIFLNFSQPDLRYVTKMNPVAHRRSYDPIGVVVMKADHLNYKKTSYNQEDRISTSLFCGMRDMSLEFVAPPGHSIIMPCTFNPHIEFKFELAVYTEFKCAIQEITTVLPKKMLRAIWRGPTAGGCVNHPKTWLNNPQFLLNADKKGIINITLEQEITSLEEAECIGIYVWKVNDRARVNKAVNPLVVPKTFLNVISSTEQLNAEANANYVVMPCTFDPIDRPFNISVSSADTNITSFVQL
jgi:hypothetical protein